MSLSIPTTPGKYYHIVLKTSNEYALMIWNSGQVGASNDKTRNEYYKWLVIPTGRDNTVWIFSKAAQGGRAQALTVPPGQKLAKQWDFDEEEDKHQQFVIKEDKRPENKGYYRLVRVFDKDDNKNVEHLETLSTRWGKQVFEWGESDTDDQQLIQFVDAGPVKDTDILPGYLFWNYKNAAIKDYFHGSTMTVPKPTLIKLKKLVFYNCSSQTVVPAVHKMGGTGTPWRNGLPQCGYKSLKPDETYTFEVSGYLEHAEEVWLIILNSAITLGAVAFTVATLGGGAEVLAGAVMSDVAAATLEVGLGASEAVVAVTADLALATKLAVFGAMDFIMFGVYLPRYAVPSLEFAAKCIAHPEAATGTSGATKDTIDAWFESKGLDRAKMHDTHKELFQTDFFYANNKPFLTFTDKWYFEETVTKTRISEMFYGDGICLFIITDDMIGKNTKK